MSDPLQRSLDLIKENQRILLADDTIKFNSEINRRFQTAIYEIQRYINNRDRSITKEKLEKCGIVCFPEEEDY